MKNIRIIVVLVAFSLILFFWTISKDSITEIDLNANRGQLDIDEINDKTIYRLTGEWEFYPNIFIMEDSINISQLIPDNKSIFDSWQNNKNFKNGAGYATYRLTLNGLNPNEEYGILLEEAGSSYQLWVNDELKLSNGEIAKNKLISKGASYTDKSVFRSDENGNAVIVLEVSNYILSDDTIKFAPMIGYVNDVIYFYETSLIVEMFVFSALTMVTVIFILLAIIVKDRRSMFMASLCALFALRVISTGNHIIYLLNPYFEFSLIWILRFEYLSVFLMLPIFTLLACTFKLFDFSKRYQDISYGMLIVFPIATIMVDHSGLEFIYLVFQVLVALYGIHFLYHTITSYRKEHIGVSSSIVLVISIIAALTSLFYFNDSRYASYFLIFIFVLFINTTVLYRFSIIHSRSEHLENIVKIDPLTKLWNRSYLSELKFEPSKYDLDEIIYVLFIDLNGFKEINDKHGHKVGDEVLRITARRLRNSCHESDMIFRLGGDEFIVIARMKSGNSIEKVIKRIRDNFNEPFTLVDIRLNLSLAIGYQEFNPSMDDIESIIAISDKKMYEDKRKQTNQ
jgi:diguanylate cyclase (GGDEF)-like protein